MWSLYLVWRSCLDREHWCLFWIHLTVWMAQDCSQLHRYVMIPTQNCLVTNQRFSLKNYWTNNMSNYILLCPRVQFTHHKRTLFFKSLSGTRRMFELSHEGMRNMTKGKPNLLKWNFTSEIIFWWTTHRFKSSSIYVSEFWSGLWVYMSW